MSNIADAAVDAQSKRPKIIAISIIFPVLSILVVSLRLYTRLFMLRRTGPDDWVIVVALVRPLHPPVRRRIDGKLLGPGYWRFDRDYAGYD